MDRATIDAAIQALGYGTEEPAAATADATKPAPEAATIDVPDAIRPLFAQAAQEGKLVALKFTAAWCAPCKAMTERTIHDPEVTAELAARFVFREIDTDALPAVSQAYGVAGIPDTRIFRADGTLVDQVRGFEGPADFLARLRAARNP